MMEKKNMSIGKERKRKKESLMKFERFG